MKEPKKYLICPRCKKLKKRAQFYWDKRTHWKCMHCAGLQVKKPETVELQMSECIESLKQIISYHHMDIPVMALHNLTVIKESLEKLEEYY